MPVYKGWNANIYVNGGRVGYATSAQVNIDHSLELYFPVWSRTASQIIEGPINITGRLEKAWINKTYLSLLNNTGTLESFELKVTVAGTMTLFLYNCKFSKGTIDIPQDGYLTEDYDFIATSFAIV